MTFGVYLGLQELGLPLDSIEVVSFGNLEFASLFHHKLSAIMQNPQYIGEIVGDLLIRRLGGDNNEIENRILVPELVPIGV
ncbi:substrate-binding domain-containing protein [Paenibacillus whitsoniae]|uniref:LacI family transcriptional regulator n=1 Tax=Paenibacillus whitsoniae TaxID=2496558 RepID=A0A430JIL7_9BACL|nr:substrate-binding domain-containing protein [Paenibacillus whitsoniae]RTE10860.1 LacI family transcriptional regulator [Paenibacillus whitsoniae]